MSPRITKITHADLMLATPGKGALERRGWVYELKYDGLRCLVVKQGQRIHLMSRRGRDMAGPAAALPKQQPA